MINIEFDYNKEKILLQAKSNDIFRDVINKYLQKTLLNPNDTYFIANGKKINQSGTVESHMSDIDKESNEIKILVQLIEDEEEKKNIIDNENNNINNNINNINNNIIEQRGNRRKNKRKVKFSSIVQYSRN